MNQQMHVPTLTLTNKVLIIVATAFFLISAVLNTYAGVSFDSLFGLSLAGIMSAKIWQIITFPFIQHGILGMVFNCLIVWFIGSELEARWGKSFYQKFLILNALVVAGVYIIISYFFWGASSQVPLVGFECLCYALLIGYALVYPDRYMTFMFLFPMKAMYFCLLLVAIEFYGTLVSPYAASAWVHLVALGFSFLYLKYLSLGARGQGLGDVFKKKRKRPDLKIIKRDDEQGPKYWH